LSIKSQRCPTVLDYSSPARSGFEVALVEGFGLVAVAEAGGIGLCAANNVCSDHEAGSETCREHGLQPKSKLSLCIG
jgi:hypothetical protein